MKVSIQSLWSGCTFSDTICKKTLTMGMRAPKLLSAAIDIPLPNAIKSLFPICASVGKITPSSGKLTSEKDLPASLALGSFVTVKDGVTKLAASATISAAKNVFPENAEVWQLNASVHAHMMTPLNLNLYK
jgi:hypothetical protein